MNLFDVVREVRRLLEENGRVSQRMVRRQFDLDEDALEEVVEELVEIQRVAARDGNGLTWIGPTPSPTRRDAIALIEAAAEGDLATPASEAARVGIHIGPVVIGEMGGGASRY